MPYDPPRHAPTDRLTPSSLIMRRTLVPLFAASVVFSPVRLPAQQGASLPGYGPRASAAERRLEAEAIARPDAARARAHSRALSAETHVAGTPAQGRTRDYVIAQMKAMGLETAG